MVNVNNPLDFVLIQEMFEILRLRVACVKLLSWTWRTVIFLGKHYCHVQHPTLIRYFLDDVRLNIFYILRQKWDFHSCSHLMAQKILAQFKSVAETKNVHLHNCEKECRGDKEQIFAAAPLIAECWIRGKTGHIFKQL